MRRQDKYPNTEMFRLENVNPKHRITCDCVIRAISKAYGWTWQETLRKMTEFSIKTGYFITDTKCYNRFLVANGAKQWGQLRKLDGTKYTLAEFIKMRPEGTYLVNMANHLTVVINGVNYDVWDCTKDDGRIGIFWEVK